MPWSWLVAGRRPQSWMRLCLITVPEAYPYRSEPIAKQIPVWRLLTLLSRNTASFAFTVGLGRPSGLRPFSFRFRTVTPSASRAIHNLPEDGERPEADGRPALRLEPGRHEPVVDAFGAVQAQPCFGPGTAAENPDGAPGVLRRCE